MELKDNPALHAVGVTFMDATGPVKIGNRWFDLRWLTTARDDIPTYEQLADLSKVRALPAQVSIEDPDSTLSVVILGRTIGLGQRRALNFTARGLYLGSLIPRNANLPDDLWLDIIIGSPFLNPDAPLEGKLIMPMDAQELRNLGFSLRRTPSNNTQALDAIHERIAAVLAKSSSFQLQIQRLHPAVRSSLEALNRPRSETLPASAEVLRPK